MAFLPDDLAVVALVDEIYFLEKVGFGGGDVPNAVFTLLYRIEGLYQAETDEYLAAEG